MELFLRESIQQRVVCTQYQTTIHRTRENQHIVQRVPQVSLWGIGLREPTQELQSQLKILLCQGITDAFACMTKSNLWRSLKRLRGVKRLIAAWNLARSWSLIMSASADMPQ